MASISAQVLRAAVAAALREFRQKADLTPEEVWGITALSPARIQEIEAAATTPSFLEVLALADVYRISVDVVSQRANEIVEAWTEGEWDPGRINTTASRRRRRTQSPRTAERTDDYRD